MCCNKRSVTFRDSHNTRLWEVYLHKGRVFQSRHIYTWIRIPVAYIIYLCVCVDRWKVEEKGIQWSPIHTANCWWRGGILRAVCDTCVRNRVGNLGKLILTRTHAHCRSGCRRTVGKSAFVIALHRTGEGIGCVYTGWLE